MRFDPCDIDLLNSDTQQGKEKFHNGKQSKSNRYVETLFPPHPLVDLRIEREVHDGDKNLVSRNRAKLLKQEEELWRKKHRHDENFQVREDRLFERKLLRMSCGDYLLQVNYAGKVTKDKDAHNSQYCETSGNNVYKLIAKTIAEIICQPSEADQNFLVIVTRYGSRQKLQVIIDELSLLCAERPQLKKKIDAKEIRFLFSTKNAQYLKVPEVVIDYDNEERVKKLVASKKYIHLKNVN